MKALSQVTCKDKPLTDPRVKDFTSQQFKSTAQDLDPLDPQDLGFLDPNQQKYADPRGKTSAQILQKNYFQNPNLNYSKKRDCKNFLISEWFTKFQHKNKRKKLDKKFENSALLKKFSKFLRNNLDPDPTTFFPVRIQDPVRIKIKWILGVNWECHT